VGALQLSVVVPVHNAEAYLRTCLDSLLAQTRPIDEIVVVDDGSTDGSSGILEEYARRHGSIRVLRGPQRGAAGARNAGLDAVSGDWIGFVDADDWIEPQMYDELLRAAVAQDLDIALCNGRYHYEGRKPDQPIYTDTPLVGPCSGAQWYISKVENRTLLHYVFVHLYRRAFIDRHRLRFIEGLMHEDVTWTTRALLLAERVAYDNSPHYVYRRQPRHFTRKALDDRLVNVIRGAKEDARILADMAAQVRDARLARALRWQLVDGGLSVFHKIRKLSNSAIRAEQSRNVLREGYLGLLRRNATEFRQRRKIAKHFLWAWLLSMR
jgi:glycosyltransferase involved in cell wall biosynthesis